MNTRSRILWTAFLAVGAWALVVPAASAYVDPGSTSFVFQALIAFAMAAGLTLKTYWRRLKDLFSGGSTDEGEPQRSEVPEVKTPEHEVS